MEDSLKLHGDVFNPIKQVRLVITTASAAQLEASIMQRAGRAAAVLILPVTAVDAWHIYGRGKARMWRAFVAALDAAGIGVDGLTSDLDSNS